MIKNFFNIIFDGLLMDGVGFTILYILISVAFAILWWVVCVNYTKLWNKRFHVSPSFHILCFIAASISFLSALSFIGLKNLQSVSEQFVTEWSENILDDTEFQNTLFEDAYYAIEEEGEENMAGFPAPEDGGHTIPVSSIGSMVLVSSIYADGACNNFDECYPFLGFFLDADAGIPTDILAEDIEDWLQSNPVYQTTRGMEVAVEYIENDLINQASQIVRTCRWWLVLLFLAVQMVPFVIIGILAYNDLNRHHVSYKNIQY